MVSPLNSVCCECLTWNVHGSNVVDCIEAAKYIVDKPLHLVFLQDIACEKGILVHDTLHDWWWVSFGPDVTSTHRGCGLLLSKDMFEPPADLQAVRSDDHRQLYNEDVQEINHFFTILWKAWGTADDLADLFMDDVTAQMIFTQNMSFDELLCSYNRHLHTAFLRYATRPQPLRFVESDKLKA